MSDEEARRQVRVARDAHHQVAGLGGHGDARRGAIVDDVAGGNAELTEGRRDLAADGAFVAGGAVDGEEAEQVAQGQVAVDVLHSSSSPPRLYRSTGSGQPRPRNVLRTVDTRNMPFELLDGGVDAGAATRVASRRSPEQEADKNVDGGKGMNAPSS